MNKTNKAFSYIEMILVISIMAITTGLASLTIGLVNRNNVEKAATKLQNALDGSRTMCMAKGSLAGTLRIARIGDSYYYCYGASNDNFNTKICSSPCELRFVQTDGTEYKLIDGSVRVVRFISDTGAFDTSGLQGIKITNNKTTTMVKFYEATGKTVIE